MDPVHMSEGAVFFSHRHKVSRKVTLNLDISRCSAINPQFLNLLGDSCLLPDANKKKQDFI